MWKSATQLYDNMEIDILTELCTILHDVGGCDALPRNQPFTLSGKIAFVDTEHVGLLFKYHFRKIFVPALISISPSHALASYYKNV